MNNGNKGEDEVDAIYIAQPVLVECTIEFDSTTAPSSACEAAVAAVEAVKNATSVVVRVEQTYRNGFVRTSLVTVENGVAVAEDVQP